MNEEMRDKAAWEMTKQEYVGSGRGSEALHKALIREKLGTQTPRTRRSVPYHVLESYPDLYEEYFRVKLIKPAEAVKVKAEAVRAEREPWEMTREDALSVAKVNRGDNWLSVKFPSVKDSYQIRSLDLPSDGVAIGKAHKDYVMEALSKGKPVPAEVLKDYPELSNMESISPEWAEEYVRNFPNKKRARKGMGQYSLRAKQRKASLSLKGFK